MTNIAFPTAAAMRSRTFSAPVAPLGIPMAGDSWLPNSNSIATTVRNVVPTVVGTPAHTQRADYGAAKQAAPPRGVPR